MSVKQRTKEPLNVVAPQSAGKVCRRGFRKANTVPSWSGCTQALLGLPSRKVLFILYLCVSWALATDLRNSLYSVILHSEQTHFRPCYGNRTKVIFLFGVTSQTAASQITQHSKHLPSCCLKHKSAGNTVLADTPTGKKGWCTLHLPGPAALLEAGSAHQLLTGSAGDSAGQPQPRAVQKPR